MTLVDGFAPPLPLQAMLVVGKPTIQKNACYHNQHCSVGGSDVARVIILGGQSASDEGAGHPRGSRGMLPREILKSRVPQMRFPAFCG